MGEDELPGYRGKLRKALQVVGAEIGDLLRVESGNNIYEGSLMPRLESADDWHIVLKLKSGYNLGIVINEFTKMTRLRSAEKPEFKPLPLPDMDKDLPYVSIISTGGTIASRVDYSTGGVRAAISSRDLLSIVPEISKIAFIDADILYSVFSENINSEHWSGIARKVYNKINNGSNGVVITHGTDTMGYSAAALSFALQKLPVPVIFVGSQRSSDRPSSDAAVNLIGSITAAAHAPFAEVVLAMHEDSSDRYVVFHRGTKVRKCHTSARYAFKSINFKPLARFTHGNIEIINSDFKPRSEKKPELLDNFEKKVTLIKFFPGFDPQIIDWYVDNDYRGMIIEGTGLGHVSTICYESIERAVKNGLLVGMTSQCIWGRIDMNVYTTGRELIQKGVQPLEDMLPETALVKLMWTLGQTEEIELAKEIMAKNIVGEYFERTFYE